MYVIPSWSWPQRLTTEAWCLQQSNTGKAQQSSQTSPSGDTNSQLFPTKFLNTISGAQGLSKNCPGLQNHVKSGFDMDYIIKVSWTELPHLIFNHRENHPSEEPKCHRMKDNPIITELSSLHIKLSILSYKCSALCATGFWTSTQNDMWNLATFFVFKRHSFQSQN